MSIEKQNLALPAIMAVATLIVLNAVVGQDGKHPAPIGNPGNHQKTLKSQMPVTNSKHLKRKSRPAKIVTAAQRKLNDDVIGRLLKGDPHKKKIEKIAKIKLVDDKKVRFVQTRLEQLGYDPGPVDGIFGQKTREAIKRFEGARRIPVTGEISRSLIEALSRSASFASLALT